MYSLQEVNDYLLYLQQQFALCPYNLLIASSLLWTTIIFFLLWRYKRKHSRACCTQPVCHVTCKCDDQLCEMFTHFSDKLLQAQVDFCKTLERIHVTSLNVSQAVVASVMAEEE